MFRLPLRTSDAATRSEISTNVVSLETARQLLWEVAKCAHEMLIFLRHVERIDVFTRSRSAGLCLLGSSAISDPSASLRDQRLALGTPGTPSTPQFPPVLRLGCRVYVGGEGENCVSEERVWLLQGAALPPKATQGSSQAEEEATEQTVWATVAMQLHHGLPTPVPGRAFVFLPLPFRTGLKVHVNAPFALSSNRRDLWSGDGMDGDGATRARWNDDILHRAVPQAYAALLEALGVRGFPPSASYAMWPDGLSTDSHNEPGASGGDVWRFAALAALKVAAERRRKIVWDEVVERWVDVHKVCLDVDGVVCSRLTKALPTLRDFGFRPALATASMTDALTCSGVDHGLASADAVVAAVRRHDELFFASEGNLDGAASRVQRRQIGVPEAEAILSFLLHGVTAETQSPKPFQRLADLRLCPLAGGGLARFQRAEAPPTGRRRRGAKTECKATLLIADSDLMDLLPGFSGFVSPEVCVKEALRSPGAATALNVSCLSARRAAMLMSSILPPSWRGLDAVDVKAELSGTVGSTRSGHGDVPGIPTNTVQLGADQQGKGKGGKGKGSRGRPNKGADPADEVPGRCEPPRRPSGPTSAATVSPLVAEAVSRVSTLWRLIQRECASPSDLAAVCELMDGWPVVPCRGGNRLISLDVARRCAIVSDARCDAGQLELVSRFGVELVCGVGEGSGAIESALGQGRNIVGMLVYGCSRHSGGWPPEQCLELRRLLLSWADSSHGVLPTPSSSLPAPSSSSSPQLAPDSLRLLPVFRTCSGRMVPAEGAVVPPDAAWSARLSEVEEVLGDSVLTVGSEGDQGDEGKLLSLAKVSRWSVEQILHLIAQRGRRIASRLDAAGCAALIAAIDNIHPSPWKDKHKPANARLLRMLSEEDLVVLDSSRRTNISQVFDPDDTLLQSLADARPSWLILPPPDYATPIVLKVMRRAGLRSLRDPSVFTAVARAAADRRDVRMARDLLSWLVFNKLHDKLSWNVAAWGAVASVAFVPVADMRQREAPVLDVWGRLHADVRALPKVLGKKGKHKGRTKLDEVEDELGVADERADESDEEEDRDSISATAGQVEFQFVSPVEESSVALWSCVWTAWRHCLLLPPELDHAPAALASLLRVPPPCHLPHVTSHLVALAPLFLDSAASAASVRAWRRSVASCARVFASKMRASSLNALEDALDGVKWIFYSAGDAVSARHIATDLLEDLGPFARAAPSYLQHDVVLELLRRLGAMSAWAGHTPRVVVRSPNPVDDLPAFIASQLNDPSLADVVFCVEGCEMYAHRLVLASSCDPIRAMVLAGTRETTSIRIRIEMEEWVTADAFRRLLAYLYLGDAEAQEPLLRHDQGAATALNLLRLADRFLLQHLKEWASAWIATHVRVDVYNVSALLSHAKACNAQQLLTFCIFSARGMFNAVRETEEWQALPEHVQCLVMGDEPPKGAPQTT